ncbi:MAG: RNA polymerase sigma factor [Ruminococcus sp.]|nr:RNA polymerase sigma factor [Ruminococcus sp.]
MDNNTALYAFRKYGDTVLRAAYACCGNYSEAEDITQDVFLILHSNPQDFESDEHMKAWLLRAAINKCKNYKKSFRVSRTDNIDDVSENQLKCNFTPRDSEIRENISKLPQKYSSVIFLYYFEGYSIREIAEMLGKNENTVNSRLQRGRKKLKIELEREGYNETNTVY